MRSEVFALILSLVALHSSTVVAQAPDPGLIIATLTQTAHDYPQAWALAHTSAPEKYDFIVLALRRLYTATNGTVRGNWRRGDVGDLSMDGISVKVGTEWRFADVIAGAGGSNPRIVYGTPGPEAALRNRAGQYIGEAGTVKPEGEPGVYPPLTTHGRYRRQFFNSHPASSSPKVRRRTCPATTSVSSALWWILPTRVFRDARVIGTLKCGCTY